MARVDAESQINDLWKQRREDRKSATKDADGRQTVVLAAIEKVEAGVERINGGMAKLDTRVTVIEEVDKDRRWSAGGGVVTPGRVAGAGGVVTGSGLIWLLLEKMDAILDALANLPLGQ